MRIPPYLQYSHYTHHMTLYIENQYHKINTTYSPTCGLIVQKPNRKKIAIIHSNPLRHQTGCYCWFLLGKAHPPLHLRGDSDPKLRSCSSRCVPISTTHPHCRNRRCCNPTLPEFIPYEDDDWKFGKIETGDGIILQTRECISEWLCVEGVNVSTVYAQDDERKSRVA